MCFIRGLGVYFLIARALCLYAQNTWLHPLNAVAECQWGWDLTQGF